MLRVAVVSVVTEILTVEVAVAEAESFTVRVAV
jgi:hypothetical protein